MDGWMDGVYDVCNNKLCLYSTTINITTTRRNVQLIFNIFHINTYILTEFDLKFCFKFYFSLIYSFIFSFSLTEAYYVFVDMYLCM